MKKILSICLVLMMVLALAPTAFAASGDGWSYNESTKKLTISKDTGDFVVDPTDPDYYDPWADFRTEVTAVYVEKKVNTIGKNAFAGMTSLTEVKFEKMEQGATKLYNIEAGAFSGCTALKSISLPKNLETIGDGAFAGCTSLTAVHFVNSSFDPAGLGDGVFAGCSSLTPDGITGCTAVYNAIANDPSIFYGLPEINGVALELGGMIRVKYRVFVPENVDEDDFSVKFGGTYRNQTIDLTDRVNVEPIEGDDYYFCFNITPMELADKIPAQAYVGGTAVGDPATFSAMDYIDAVIKADEDEYLVALVKALEAYGYYLQQTGWTDNLGPHTAIVDPEYAIDLDYVKTQTADCGIEYDADAFQDGVSVTLTLNTTTTLKVKDKSNNNYLKKVGIGPKDLDYKYDFQLRNGLVKASALTYVNLMLNSSQPEAEKNAMAALYYYWVAAENYTPAN